MATTPNVTVRNDITLRSTDLMLLDLLDRAADWDASPEDERLDFFLEWEEMMDRLSHVAEDGRSDRLRPDQQQRLMELARRLQEARDVIVRLGLDYPELGHLSLAS
jgi:hypothetical protein